jgi:hypothetical protein
LRFAALTELLCQTWLTSANCYSPIIIIKKDHNTNVTNYKLLGIDPKSCIGFETESGSNIEEVERTRFTSFSDFSYSLLKMF